MIIQNVNEGPKAVCSISGTVLTVEIPGVDSLAIDLQPRQTDVLTKIDISLGRDYTKLSEGVGSWYVAHVTLPPVEKELYETDQIDEDGNPQMALITMPLHMDSVVVHLWGLPETAVVNEEDGGIE